MNCLANEMLYELLIPTVNFVNNFYFKTLTINRGTIQGDDKKAVLDLIWKNKCTAEDTCSWSQN